MRSPVRVSSSVKLARASTSLSGILSVGSFNFQELVLCDCVPSSFEFHHDKCEGDLERYTGLRLEERPASLRSRILLVVERGVFDRRNLSSRNRGPDCFRSFE